MRINGTARIAFWQTRISRIIICPTRPPANTERSPAARNPPDPRLDGKKIRVIRVWTARRSA
jgi:hypothetical protein